MIEQESITSSHFGHDGFYWFVGQVVADKWWRKDDHKQSNDYGYRAKLRILGKHPATKDIEDNELPWAHFLMPATMGSGNNHYGVSNTLQGGETVVGFFLDGIEAQQPIVIGSLYAHKNIENIKSWDDVISSSTSGFQPISVDPILKLGTPTKVSKNGTDIGGIPDNNDKIIDDGGSDTETIGKQQNNEKITLTKATECTIPKIEMGDASKAMKNLMKTIQKLEKVKDGYIDPVLNTLVNVDKLVDRAAQKMAGSLSGVISRARTELFKEIDAAIEDKIDFLDPNFLSKQLGIEEAKDGIYCLLQNLMKGLKDTISKFIKSLLGKLLNFPLCAAESFLSGLFSNILDKIKKGIAPFLTMMRGLTGISIPSFSGMLGKAFDGIQELLNLLQCEGSDCDPDISDWILNEGPESKDALDFQKMVGMTSLLGKIDSGIDGLVGGMFPGLTGDSDGSISEMEQLAGPCNPYDPETCNPPSVQIFGGGGIGAFAKAVVNNTGAIVGVKMEKLGLGFDDVPYVTFIDNCRNGMGATAVPIIRDGVMENVVITNPGDGYLGGGSDGEQVVGEIVELDIVSTGTDYQTGDTITTPEGCVFTPTIENGRITGATGRCTLGQNLPQLKINSKTGYGAVVRPITTFVPVSEYSNPVVPESQILTVVDCPRGS